MPGADHGGSANTSGSVAGWQQQQQSEQARAAATAAAATAAPAPPSGGIGGRNVDRGGEGGGNNDADSPPASIMHAAYVGALELVKSMVEVRWLALGKKINGLCLVQERGLLGGVDHPRSLCADWGER